MSNSLTLVSHELPLAIFTEPDENFEIQSQSLSNNEAIINGANEICNSPKIRDRFEELNERSTDSLIGSRISNYSAPVPGISFANISNIHPAKIFGYAFALFYDRIHLVQILSMFSKTNSTFHSYIDVPVKAIDSLSYISVKVFIHYRGGIFCSCGHSEYNVFSHISAKQVIYYLGKSAILQENSALGLGMVTLQSQVLQIFETLNTEATISFLMKCTNQK
ncbi:hypothetical protein F8M41_010550 [Gigaspora margarita]|uniref:Uncharacterized protein n=1 Tax=Gigaspora margarita TaxID=4874 RepID=A0A8H3X226_GIGMA|nr:hypothetical protein F8M41_010550 [Gigaspora margarita]